MQKWLEKNREKLQKDFDTWLANKRRERGLGQIDDEKEHLSETVSQIANQLKGNTSVLTTSSIRDQNVHNNINKF